MVPDHIVMLLLAVWRKQHMHPSLKGKISHTLKIALRYITDTAAHLHAVDARNDSI